MAKFKLGKSVSFGSLKDRQVYILEGVLMSLDYIGKESKLTKTERDLKRLAQTKINRIIRELKK